MKAIYKIAALAGGALSGFLLCAYWQQQWYKENAPFGRALGYPECCIKEFCNQPPQLLKINGTGKTDKMRFEAAHINGEYTGFIPCAFHAKKIMEGEITLASLIKNRDAAMPAFPNL